jgi:type I restriction enzyme S subunit
VEEIDYLDLADTSRRCQLGDIVYSRNASAGSAALVVSEEAFTMGQDVCRITSQSPNQKYLYYALNHLVEPQLAVARVGSTFTRINVDQIKGLRVPVPSWERQQEISRLVDAQVQQSATVLSVIERQIGILQELKQSLISAAVSGEFDVSSADGSRVVA